MRQVQAGQGVSEFEVVADSTNNTPSTIDNYELHVDLYFSPTKAAERIVLGIIITRTGVNFDDLRTVSGAL